MSRRPNREREGPLKLTRRQYVAVGLGITGMVVMGAAASDSIRIILDSLPREAPPTQVRSKPAILPGETRPAAEGSKPVQSQREREAPPVPPTIIPEPMTYQRWKGMVAGVSYPEYTGRIRSGEKPDSLYRQARGIVQQGVELYNQRSSPTLKIEMPNDDTVDVFDTRYDLKSKSGLVFAQAILASELAFGHYDEKITRGLQRSPDTDLRVLSGKINLLEGQSEPFVDPVEMARLARLIDSTEKTGLDYPKEWMQTEGRGGWNLSAGKAGALEFTSHTVVSSWPDYYLARDPSLGRDFAAIIDKIQDGERNVNMVTIPDGNFMSKGDRLFTGAFVAYLEQGITFERRARYLDASGSHNGARLIREQRDRLVALFGGVEFNHYGSIKLPQPEYATGDIVKIRDISPHMQGDPRIRPVQSLLETPHDTTVLNEDVVRLGEKVTVMEPSVGWVGDMWYVRTGQMLSGDRWVMGNSPKGQGYRIAEGLGEIVRKS